MTGAEALIIIAVLVVGLLALKVVWVLAMFVLNVLWAAVLLAVARMVGDR